MPELLLARHVARPAMLLSLLGAAPAASAAGFSSARFGGEHGTPVSPNPTAVYYNPAAMTGADGAHVLLDAAVLLRADTYAHAPHPTDVPEPAGLEGANTSRATLCNVSLVPLVGGTYALDDWALGAAFYVPFGGGSMWDEDERFADNPAYPGAAGGSQRWHALDGTLAAFYWTVAVAYEIPKTGLSLGLSGSLVHTTLQSLNARTVMGDNDLESEGRSLLDVGSWGGGIGAGAMFEAVAERLWLGASYTSRPNVAGGQRLAGTLRNNFGSVDEFEVALSQDLPDIVRLGVRFKPTEATELRLHGDFTRWSAFANQCVSLEDEACEVDAAGHATGGRTPLQNVRRSWDDAWGLRLGLSVWPSARWELFTGVGYDSNAIPDETLEPSFLDFDDFATAVGARYELVADHLAVEMAYTHFYNIPRDNAGASVLATTTEPFNRAPDAGGTYTEVAGLLNVDLEASF